MEKIVKIDYRAEKELNAFSEQVQDRFEGLIRILRQQGRIDFPEGKKIGKNIFEIRIKIDGVYRGFYAYIGSTGIVVLHFFRKKSQKTPLKDIRVAERRLKEYE